MDGDTAAGLTIGAVAARTGLGVPVLRAWEDRFGFPNPGRLPSGHRRYAEGDVRAIQRVLAERATGRSLESAIDVVNRDRDPVGPEFEASTVFAGLRALRPELSITVLGRRGMLALSRSIEDECLASAVRPRLGVAFQRATEWRAARRWNDLTELATATTVFADFAHSARREHRVTEVAITRDNPLAREWSVLCQSARFSALLAGWERPDGRFETIWTVDPGAVHTGFGILDVLSRVHAPNLVPPHPDPTTDQRRGPVRSERSLAASAEAIALRAVARLGG